MYGTLPYCTLALFIDIFTLGSAINTTLQISFFEYGAHAEDEHVSVALNGYIPPFVPQFTLNVTPFRPDLEKRFTYLRVEYVSVMSTVEIMFNEETCILSFYIRFPFLNIPYGVVGYSTTINLRSKVWNSWRRTKAKQNESRTIVNFILENI